MAAAAGYNATIGGVCNSGTKWTVEETQDLLDATTFCSLGFREYVKGLQSATYTIESYEEVDIDEGTSVIFANDLVTITGNTLNSTVTYDTSVDGLCTFTYKGNFTGQWTTT